MPRSDERVRHDGERAEARNRKKPLKKYMGERNGGWKEWGVERNGGCIGIGERNGGWKVLRAKYMLHVHVLL